MFAEPSPNDWLMYSRTYDAQRFSPLNQIEKRNVGHLDRATGEFLWATPFPYDTPNFGISKIDGETGKTYINWDLVFKKDGDRHIVCYLNATGYWPSAYHPGNNSLYLPFHDVCGDLIAETATSKGQRAEVPIRRPGSDPNAFGGIAKVNMATGQIQRFYTARIGGNGAVLATAGDLIFWGDLNRRFRAFDADTGKIRWETILGGIIQNSTVTYAVNGKQYIAVLRGTAFVHTSRPLSLVLLCRNRIRELAQECR